MYSFKMVAKIKINFPNKNGKFILPKEFVHKIGPIHNKCINTIILLKMKLGKYFETFFPPKKAQHKVRQCAFLH